VRQSSEQAALAYVSAQHRLGRDITLSGVYAALPQPGVQNVDLASPVADLTVTDAGAAYCTSVSVSVGGSGV
jgi:phage-related baseplate assembly protein